MNLRSNMSSLIEEVNDCMTDLKQGNDKDRDKWVSDAAETYQESHKGIISDLSQLIQQIEDQRDKIRSLQTAIDYADEVEERKRSRQQLYNS